MSNAVKTDKPKATLTINGRIVGENMREERERNMEMHGGEYVPDPWYKCYLSRGFEIPERTPERDLEAEREAIERLSGTTRSQTRRKQIQKENEDTLEGSDDADEMEGRDSDDVGSDPYED